MAGESRCVAVIPARYGSKRLPGKPLADLAGRPLVVHAWQAARSAALGDRVVVATDDARIARVVRDAGGEVSPERLVELTELADGAHMAQVRHRVQSIVEDPGTANALQPWYRLMCKRPCFHDECSLIILIIVIILFILNCYFI